MCSSYLFKKNIYTGNDQICLTEKSVLYHMWVDTEERDGMGVHVVEESCVQQAQW